jgi:uncharacterized protein (DUF2225 family)
LRVKKIKGKHKVHCPSCGEDFNKNIIIWKSSRLCTCCFNIA